MRPWTFLPTFLVGLSTAIGTPEDAAARSLRQEDRPESDRRPRIGLVLSGGGARGAAHVGVLDVLEELHVPVDFVVGTSIGAIVGGLYAAGYSPEEMRDVLSEADWNTLLSDTTPRERLWFRRRQDSRRHQVDMELGWKNGGPALPPGLVLGRNVEAFMEQLTIPVQGVKDFDELRIPFRCVATDLSNGTPVVFDGGPLSTAMRASMSLPGIFAPVEHEGRFLVDGGVVDNIPVDVAHALGAEVVIVVDISTPLAELERPQSPFGVSNQVIGILMSENRRRAQDLIDDADIAITPELGDISLLAFERTLDAVQIGREATAPVRDRLEALRVDDAAWAAFLERQRMPPSIPPVVRNLVVVSSGTLPERVIRRHASIREGEPLTEEALHETREALAGLGAFAHIVIDVQPVPDSPREVDVVLRPIAKDWGPNYLRFALDVSSNLQGDGDFAIGVQHTRRPFNSLGGEWRNEVLVGTRSRLYSELYQPLDSGLRWFVAPSIEFQQSVLPILSGGAKVAEVNVQTVGLGVDVGRNLGSWGEFRAGYRRLEGDIRPEVAIPGILPSSIDVRSDRLTSRVVIDTLDSVAFPTHGVIGEVGWIHAEDRVLADSRKTVLDATIGTPLTFDELTVLTTLEGGATVDGADGLGAEFSLGGFRRLSGLAPNEIAGNHYALAVVQPYFQLSDRDAALGVGRYFGLSLEYGGVWGDLDELSSSDLLFSASVYMGFDTFLGPAFVGYGLTEGGNDSVYVFIGSFL